MGPYRLSNPNLIERLIAAGKRHAQIRVRNAAVREMAQGRGYAARRMRLRR